MKSIAYYIPRLPSCPSVPVRLRDARFSIPNLPGWIHAAQNLKELIWHAVITSAVTIPPGLLKQMLDTSKFLFNENNEYMTDENGRPLTW